MSDNARIVFAMIAGLLAGSALTCCVFVIRQCNAVLRELKRDRERRTLNRPTPVEADMPINQFLLRKAPVDRA